MKLVMDFSSVIEAEMVGKEGHVSPGGARTSLTQILASEDWTLLSHDKSTAASFRNSQAPAGQSEPIQPPHGLQAKSATSSAVTRCHPQQALTIECSYCARAQALPWRASGLRVLTCTSQMTRRSWDDSRAERRPQPTLGSFAWTLPYSASMTEAL